MAPLYQAFNPLRPLRADETDLYVDWQAELPEADDIKPQLVSSIQLEEGAAIRLVTGHRGGGKTTELYRVSDRLLRGDRAAPRFVSFLRASSWLDMDTVTASQVVFQLVRQLVADLAGLGYDAPREALGPWWRQLWEDFRRIRPDGVDLGLDPLKVTLTLADLPTGRREFDELLGARLPTLFDLVNQRILGPATQWLARERGFHGIVLIADELDRIPQTLGTEHGLTNQEQLFLGTAGTLRALDCSIVYTLPIELAYSGSRLRLEAEYGTTIHLLPTIPACTRAGVEGPGVEALRSMVAHRAERGGLPLSGLIADEALLHEMLLLSGGYPRELLSLFRSVVGRAAVVPVAAAFARRGMRRARPNAPHTGQTAEDRRLLHKVHRTKGRAGSDEWWNAALRDRWVFPYEDEAGFWFDRNPALDPEADG